MGTKCVSGEYAVDVYALVFFFQAEDGIRDYKVTGVQTCALPIWLESLRDVLQLADVDADTARTLEAALFGDSNVLPSIGPDAAAVLIEAVKDLFYQAYVRTAKLRAAMKMRRYFVDETLRNVTPIDRARRDSTAKTS